MPVATAVKKKQASRAAPETWEAAAACLLLALAAAVLVKTVFFGLELDEEYAISIGYRLVKGDRLFYSMWEPHQLSALPAAALVALFMALTGGTTGVLLFVRVVMVALKAVLSAVFYRQFRDVLGRRGAFLAALVLLVYTPKWFLGPDYISQQFHFTLAAFLCYWAYQAHGCRRPWLVAAGSVLLCLSFLAFPQSIFAAPVYFAGMVVLGVRSGEKRWLRIPRGAVILALSCAVCGGAFVAYVLRGMDLGTLLSRAELILNDPQYNFSTGERLALLGSQALGVAKFLAKPLLLAAVCCALWAWRGGMRETRRLTRAFWTLWAVFSVLLCLVRAVVYRSPDERYFLPVLVLAGAWAFYENRTPAARILFWLGYLPGLTAYAFILRSTLLGLAPTFMYLTWPAVCGVLALLCQDPADGAPQQTESARCGQALLLAVLVFLLVCRGWLILVTGWHPASVADTEMRCLSTGPAAGTWADEKTADLYDALTLALEGCEGKKVLLSTGDVDGLAFLMNEGTMEVGQASVISSTDSDVRFAGYYNELPEKTPDVIVYNYDCVRDLDQFHEWLETNLNITARRDVSCGTARLEVLTVEN